MLMLGDRLCEHSEHGTASIAAMGADSFCNSISHPSKNGIPFEHYDEILRQYTDGEGITFSYWLEKKEPITKERRIVQLPYSEEPALNNLSLLQFSLALSCRYEFPETEE